MDNLMIRNFVTENLPKGSKLVYQDKSPIYGSTIHRVIASTKVTITV